MEKYNLSVILNFMELKSGNEQLERVNREIDGLIGNIKLELSARSNVAVELDDGTVRGLLKYINNPLRNLSINGNEAVLDDMLDLYDEAIGKLDEIIQARQYNENEPLDPSELTTFKKVKNVLEQGKESKVGVIDKIYTEIIREDRSGDLIETYKGRKISDIDMQISDADQKLQENRSPMMRFYKEIKPELEKYKKSEKDAKKIETYNQSIQSVKREIAAKAADPATTEEEKNALRQQLEAKLQEKVEFIYHLDPKYAEDNSLKQGAHEALEAYADRLEKDAFEKTRDKNEQDLTAKLLPYLKEEVKVAEVDRSTGKFVINSTKIEDRYFPASVGALDLDPAELQAFASKIETDISYIQAATDKQVEEKSKLEAERTELLKDTEEMSLVLKTPYEPKENGKEVGRFGKWMQRRAFLKQNPDLKESLAGLKGKDKKSFLEGQMIKKKQKSVSTFDRSAVLKDIERQHKNNPFKEAIKAKVKTNIYARYDQQIDEKRQSRTGHDR